MLGILRKLDDAAGAVIDAVTITNAALTASESFAPGGMDAIGLFLNPGNTATGTTPTIAFALEMSPDGGTSWGAVTKPDGSTASVTTGAIGTGSAQVVWTELPVVETGASSDILYRWAVTYNNADNDFVAVTAWLMGRKFNQRAP